MTGQADLASDYQSTSEPGPTVAREYEEAARKASRPFRPVYLTCDARVNLERAQSDERRRGGTTKPTDGTVLLGIIEQSENFRFQGHPGLEIDNTCRSPAEVAREILAWATKSHRDLSSCNEQDLTEESLDAPKLGRGRAACEAIEGGPEVRHN